MPTADDRSDPADLRKHPRYPFTADVEVAPADDPSLRPFWAVSENISMGGMFVATERVVAIDLKFSATIHPTGVPPLKLPARVVHVKRGVGFGCIFLRLPPTAEMRLLHWLGRSGGLPPVAGTIRN